MAIDLTPFPNLLFLGRVFTELGLTVREDLSRNDLRKCEKAAGELKKIASRISSLRSSGFGGMASMLSFLQSDKKAQLINYLKTNCTSEVQKTPQPEGSSAFWATTAQQMVYWLGEADQQLARGFDVAATQIVGAAVFLGLSAAAVYRLRFGDISLLQRLIPAL